MMIENLTSPGVDPVDGDLVRIIHGNGAIEVKQYFTPAHPRPPDYSGLVNAERDRRIAAGTTLSVTGYGNVPLAGTDRDMIIISVLLTKASGYKAAGVVDPIMVIRDTNNVTHMLTPDQMIELTSKGMVWVEDTMKVSWAMKDGTTPFTGGIPSDFTSDTYWP